ncbi:23S rRNA (adenine(1618)-N(6))-methyltransferase RlmF [Flavobacterium sediminilitoris]|uniref:Ribosomal RNA large subunit methyltransferase F n=1 Tax=Flavobacterium sediminilitoris TaxID=2024526 RepID=A0ABY4HM94_9FLAO|nr:MULTISPECIES: 23S rRNA (adenine(1618)-N(6))-methyltransferase RlmF [Flavobacterium]UOX32574.1 23S rRNA (adenine(1618)-N(6))-methyltransferase RlmF [Flavobacterium sediminilitoris]
MKKENNIPIKKNLHPRNKHINGYDFASLIETNPKLKNHVLTNKYGNETIDFANPEAVKALNKTLLLHFYDVTFWDIPKTNLCPPIPGRADYVHYIADLLATSNNNKIPKGNHIKGLDIGIGANCIYPIIGNKEYQWKFIGTETDVPSLKACAKIIENNEQLNKDISIRIQQNKRNILKNCILENERFDFTICNPPFHSSRQEATKGSQRKLRNLGKANEGKPILNFSGQNNELWTEGGELTFITNLIYESAHFKKQCMWFTSLVSKKENLKPFYNHLKKVGAVEVKTIDMEQGNKISRFIAWSFLTTQQQENWAVINWD